MMKMIFIRKNCFQLIALHFTFVSADILVDLVLDLSNITVKHREDLKTGTIVLVSFEVVPMVACNHSGDLFQIFLTKTRI